jgi:tripartite-type tricarboxylate transporter receptor subunit TctC
VRSLMRWCACVVALGVMTTSAAPQNFPNRPVRVIVPFAAGGPNDAAARLIAEAMRPHLGQSVVVENRGGAGGLAGADAVANAAPDGYLLLLGTVGPLVIVPTAKASGYDVLKVFAPIGQVYRSAQVLAVHPKLGVKTMADLVAYAKANPGKLNIGSAGLGTLTHLAIEVLKREAGVDVTHVPYRGTAAALTDLLGGQIDALFGEVSVMTPNVRSGNVVALAITSPDRSKLLPDVPTMAEARLPALELESWGGLLTPAGVPAPVRERLEQALQKALLDTAFRSAADKQGWGEHTTTSGGAFAKLLANETAKWKPIVTSPGFKLN